MRITMLVLLFLSNSHFYRMYWMLARVNKKECVIHELYDVLEKIRYPEIAQTRFQEFEDTILTGTKRTDLLHWLLQESPGFNSSFLNKLKDTTRNDKLVKCYSQIGLCNDIHILLGKCHIDKQLQFFTLLTLFIKNVHLVKIETQENKETTNTLPEANIESIRNTDVIELQNTNGKSEIISDNATKNLESPTNIINKQLYEKNNLDELCTCIKDNVKKLSDQKTDNFETVLHKFNAAFKKITSITIQDTHFNIFSKFYSDLCSDIQIIHSTILNVNKTIINEIKVKNRQKPEIPTKATKPLTLAIKDNIVLNEQARNMINRV